MAAARRKGKWSGGVPILGYDVDRAGPRLMVNKDEARRVREIFDLYLQHEAILPVVQELNRRGWHTKRWTMHNGQERGGEPFDKCRLHRLLTNVTYLGKTTGTAAESTKSRAHPGPGHPLLRPGALRQGRQLR